MAEGHGWGGAPPWGFNHPAPASTSAAPPYRRRGAFSSTNVVVFSEMEHSVSRNIELVGTLVEGHAQDVGNGQAAVEGDNAVQDLAGQVAEQWQG